MLSMAYEFPPAYDEESIDELMRQKGYPPGKSEHFFRLNAMDADEHELVREGTPYYAIIDDMLLVGATEEVVKKQLEDWAGPNIARKVTIYDSRLKSEVDSESG